ncbi:Rok-like winged helix domain-containing protein [Bacillus swezeyi]|uniref:Rok-like winged helix domain-containing protein n=1 Tax=Bacillus swezeyi TaxID=1925020 RepID=UPI003F8C84E0
MFNERESLRLKLEQLNDKEITIMQEIQKERDNIYSKLRELDGKDVECPTNNKKLSLINLAGATVQKLKQTKNSSQQSLPTNKVSPLNPATPTLRRSKTSIQREAALEILSKYKDGIRGARLRTEIAKETGMKIKNMNAFMDGLMKHHTEVKKPYRGQYAIQYEKSSE